MKKLTTRILLLSLILSTAHAAVPAPEKALIPVQERNQLKRIHLLVRASIEEGGEDLRNLLQEQGLQRGKGSPELARHRVKTYIAKDDNERADLLRSALSLAKNLIATDDNQGKVEIMKRLVPLLKQLPPPRRPMESRSESEDSHSD